MQEISLDELDELSPALEAAVDRTPSIDQWCSGPDWQIPVTTAFAPDAEHLLLTTEARDGFAMLAKYQGDARTSMLGGMEPLWGFGTPIVGRDIQAIASELADVLTGRDDWQTLFLAGMPLAPTPSTAGAETNDVDPQSTRVKPDPTVTLAIAFALSSLGQVGFAEGITRQIADLTDGYEPWLARRTARFRRNLRQAAGRAEAAGLTIEDASNDRLLFERMMSIEHRSWKGREGSGITSREMSSMYESMIARLAGHGRLAAHVAVVNGNDVGYILGGVRNRRYRGLQLSYSDDARSLSVGNLLQDHQLRLLHGSDQADTYDLGMDFDYKRRWADRPETSLTLVVNRR